MEPIGGEPKRWEKDVNGGNSRHFYQGHILIRRRAGVVIIVAVFDSGTSHPVWSPYRDHFVLCSLIGSTLFLAQYLSHPGV